MIKDINIEEVQPDGTKKKIASSDSKDAANGYHNYLIMFNAVVDLDFSILRMIQAEYNNPKFIDEEVMHMTTKEVKYRLINRTDPNPVSICIKDKELADNIYKEIMLSRYSDLLKEEKAQSLARSRYVLFELPLNADPLNLNKVIYSILEQV